MKSDMDHFQVRYIPGGMSLSHSAWWLCQCMSFNDGTTYWYPHRRLKVSEYK
jgi:hypothetical protein